MSAPLQALTLVTAALRLDSLFLLRFRSFDFCRLLSLDLLRRTLSLNLLRLRSFYPHWLRPFRSLRLLPFDSTGLRSFDSLRFWPFDFRRLRSFCPLRLLTFHPR